MAPLDEKDKMDGLLRLAKIHRDQFDERRRTEWKFVFVVLAFYFSLITAKLTKQIDSDVFQSSGMGFVIFGISIITCIYLAFIHNANYTNKSAAVNAENEVEKLLGYSNNEIFTKDNTQKCFLSLAWFKDKLKELSKKHPWFNWSSASQWFLITLIAIGTFIVLRST